MHFLVSLFFVLTVFSSSPAMAGPAEARDIARQNNCAPKKVEVYQQKMGSSSQTTYRVECIEPKTVGDAAQKMPNAMLVRCDGAICDMLKPVDLSAK